MTSKQRAFLKSLAMSITPCVQIGKGGLTPEVTNSVIEAFNTRELVKIALLRNCAEDAQSIAFILSERSGSSVVQVIGKKIILYKEGKGSSKKIELPSGKKD